MPQHKLIVPLVLLLTSVAFADSVYVVSAGITGDGVFGTVNLATGAYRQIGPTEPDGYFGMATGPTGTLYTLNYAGQLDRIDPATGRRGNLGRRRQALRYLRRVCV